MVADEGDAEVMDEPLESTPVTVDDGGGARAPRFIAYGSANAAVAYVLSKFAPHLIYCSTKVYCSTPAI